MAEQKAFDPSRYLTKVGNADYLEVKWRLVWLREIHPDAQLNTELVSNGNDWAVFKATISIPGGGSASGFGSEAYNDFRDYLEKAETKAIGRACAALGFGTQFCPDFEFGASQGSVVDAPIDFASTRGRRMDSGSNDGDRRVASLNQPVTPRQLKFIQQIAREKGMSDDELNADIERTYGKATVAELDRRDASAYIDRLQARRPANDMGFSQGETDTPAQTVDRSTGEVFKTGGASDNQINYVLALGKLRGFVVIGDDGKEHANVEQCIAAVNCELGTSYGHPREMTMNAAKELLNRWAPPKDEQPPQQRSAQDEPMDDDTAWTTLWKELRAAGIPSGNIPAATDLIGTWNSDNPAALLATLRMKVASMPRQQGSAGNDRFTS